jgi:hypothetical protein
MIEIDNDNDSEQFEYPKSNGCLTVILTVILLIGLIIALTK